MVELREGTDVSTSDAGTQKILYKMLNLSQYKHVWQHPDSCGSACIVIALKTLRGESPDQAKIHQEIFDPVWDGSKPESVEKYLVERKVKARLLKNQTLEDIKGLLDKDMILISLITDDFPTIDDDPPSGHYVIIQDVDFDSNMATLIDPSNAKRYFSEEEIISTVKNGYKPQRKSNYKIRLDNLQERLHDEVAPGVDGRGYVIAIDTKE